MSYLLDAFAVVCALVCLHLLQYRNKYGKRYPPLPPGPKGLPLIGNVFDMSEKEVWKAAQRWGETYGPMVHFSLLGTSYIALNSYQSAVDLLEKRGSKYSHRPINTMLKLEGWDQWLVGMMQYGDELRKSRQMLYRFLQAGTVENYTELQKRSAYRMLNSLLKSPDKCLELLRYAASEAILIMTYGYQTTGEDDPYIEIVEKGVDAFSEAAGFFLVNNLPWLQYLPAWFPGTGFKQVADKGKRNRERMFREPYNMAKANLLSEEAAGSSMLTKLLEANATTNKVISESLIEKVTGVTYAGGADTTVSTLESFLLAMLLYPEAQYRAQDELDRVLGKDVLPTFDDRPKLPYIDAIVKESLRWQPVAAIGIPHTTEEDDEYNGYFIPKGTTIFSNVWAIARDPKVYPEPNSFIPDRWLPADGKEPPLDIHKVAFGFGRRICPGRYFANNTIWIVAASMLAAFNVSKAPDENGDPITPSDDEYTPILLRHPKPFKYVLTPRSDKIKSVIRQAVESAII